MAKKKKISSLFGFDKDDDREIYPEDEYYVDEEEDTGKKKNNDITEINGNKMILLEPRAYSESQQIADHLKKRNSVVVNLKRVTSDQAKRIIDFLSGCIYAIGGTMQKVGVGIYLCAPNNIAVQGKISDETDKVKDQVEDEIDF